MKFLFLLLFSFTTFAVQPTDLTPAAEILARKNHPLYKWTNMVYGRVFQVPNGSGVVWTQDTPSKTPLFLSAGHVFWGLSFNKKEGFLNLEISSPSPRLISTPMSFPQINGDFVGRFVYAPTIVKVKSDIPPETDFVVGVIAKGIDQLTSGKPLKGPLAYLDPAKTTLGADTIAEAKAGDLSMMIGYPAGGEMAVAVGKILNETETLQKLKETKDPLPFNPKAEFVLGARGYPGISGGGVFNQKGQLIGVVVQRGLDLSKPGEQFDFCRVVRVTYIREKFYAELAKQKGPDLLKLAPYLETPSCSKSMKQLLSKK